MTLRAKIAALVVGLTIALLGGLWLLLSSSWTGWSSEAVDRDLAARLEMVRTVIEVKKDGRIELEDEHAPALADPNHPFRISGPGGFEATHGGFAWPPADAVAARPRLRTITGPDGRRWRVISQLVPLTHDKRYDRRQPVLASIEVAGPAEPYAALEERFRRGLLLAVAGALVLGGLGGMVLVHLSLAPLRRLTSEVDSMGATSLERRIGTAGLDPELRKLATAFNALLDRIDSAMQLQRGFVARASHSLRTPISTILTRAEVALRRDRDAPAYRDALADVAGAARDASELVTHLLTLTRLDERRTALHREPIPLLEVARDVERLVASRAAEAGIALRVDVPEDLVAMAERIPVRELLQALVENALRYTPRGGAAGIGGARHGDACVLEVWDTGPGIPVEERVRAFDRFQRGAAADASGAPGSGLGLAIVKAIADAHGATVQLGDRPGGGLTVVVTFPAAAAVAARQVQHAFPS